MGGTAAFVHAALEASSAPAPKAKKKGRGRPAKPKEYATLLTGPLKRRKGYQPRAPKYDPAAFEWLQGRVEVRQALARQQGRRLTTKQAIVDDLCEYLTKEKGWKAAAAKKKAGERVRAYQVGLSKYRAATKKARQ